MLRRSRFAAQFIDSHPVLTPRKIMSDRRLMLPEYRKLCVIPLYFNDPRCDNIYFKCHRIEMKFTQRRYHRICVIS